MRRVFDQLHHWLELRRQKLRETLLQQRLHLREWRRTCLPRTVVLVLVWIAGLVLISFVPLPAPLLFAATIVVALLPLLIAMHWLIPIPTIWGISGSWVALGLFAVSAFLALFGRYFAGLELSELTHENPVLFPIAQAVGSYFGAVIGLMILLTLPVLLLMLLGLTVVLIRGIAGLSGRRRLKRDLIAYGLIAGLAASALASVNLLERLATRTVRSVMLQADFYPYHLCGTETWPEGITRVAFVGDEQVLAYNESRASFIVLPCKRIVTPLPVR